MKYIISVNDGEDFIKKTGYGNTWVYSDKKDASKFNTKKSAKNYTDIMPKHLKLTIEATE